METPTTPPPTAGAVGRTGPTRAGSPQRQSPVIWKWDRKHQKVPLPTSRTEKIKEALGHGSQNKGRLLG